MSLRTRLILVVVVLFGLGLLEVTVRTLITARRDVAADIIESRQLAAQVIEIVASSAPENRGEQWYSELERLEALGRFEVVLGSESDGESEGERAPAGQFRSEAIQAPGWFVGFLNIDAERLLINFRAPGGRYLRVTVDPSMKINAIWAEVAYTLKTSLGSLVMVAMVLYLLIGQWLKPIGNIITALDQLVKGDFSKRIPYIRLSEINEIAHKINFLASVLGASKSDNERLARQAMTVQEQERRFLAEELHDTLGQAVSAIKAMAVSIANRSRETEPRIAESAANIEKISDEAYSSVRNLMAWLRPAVLDELGLKLALQQMVDDWNMHHEDTFCSLSIEAELGELKEQQQIQLYRIVQEALTNVAKHADAERVSIEISGQEIVTLIISDDGRGFDGSSVRMGIGLTNIRDRANLLRGNLTVSSKRGKGTTLHIEFPRGHKFRRRRHG